MNDAFDHLDRKSQSLFWQDSHHLSLLRLRHLVRLKILLDKNSKRQLTPWADSNHGHEQHRIKRSSSSLHLELDRKVKLEQNSFSRKRLGL